MARNKYVKDYRLLETFDEKGRVHTDYEYIGDAYRFRASGERVARARRISLGACLLGWLLFLGGMIPPSTAMHTIYVSLPYAFSALPLGILTELAVTAFRVKEPMEHHFSDRLNNRFPPAALAVAVLSAASLLGELINLLRGFTLLSGDAVFTLCGALYFACGCLAFGCRKDLETRKA